jgi:hypothetical protein
MSEGVQSLLRQVRSPISGGGSPPSPFLGPTPGAVDRASRTLRLHKRLHIYRTVELLTNDGGIPHNLRIDGMQTPNVAPGGSAKLTVTFTKPGRYPYLCTLPGHAEAGMKGVLVVK